MSYVTTSRGGRGLGSGDVWHFRLFKWRFRRRRRCLSSLICQQRTIFAFELNESCVHFVDVAYVIVFGQNAPFFSCLEKVISSNYWKMCTFVFEKYRAVSSPIQGASCGKHFEGLFCMGRFDYPASKLSGVSKSHVRATRKETRVRPSRLRRSLARSFAALSAHHKWRAC